MERLKTINDIRETLTELRTIGAFVKENFSLLTEDIDEEKFLNFGRLNATRDFLTRLIAEQKSCYGLYGEVLQEPPPESFGEMERLLHEAEVKILETSVFGRARKFLDLVTDNPDYQKELTRHLKKLQALFGKKNFNENAAEPYAKFIDAMNAPTTGAKISAIQELLNFFSADFIGAGLFDGELIHSTNEPVEEAAEEEVKEIVPEEPAESDFVKALRESNALLSDEDFSSWEESFSVDKRDRDKEFSAKRFKAEFGDTGSLQPLLLMAASRSCVAFSVTPPKKFTPEEFENAAQFLLNKGYLQKFTFADLADFYGMTKKFSDFVRSDGGKKFINSITKGHKGFPAVANYLEEDARVALTRAIYFRLNAYEKESDKNFVTADFYAQAFREKFRIGDERVLMLGCFWDDFDECDKFLKKLRQYLSEMTRGFDRVIVAGLTLGHAERVFAALKTVLAEKIPTYVDVYFYSAADDVFYLEGTEETVSPEEFFTPVEDDDFDDEEPPVDEIDDDSTDEEPPVDDDEPEPVDEQDAPEEIEDAEPPEEILSDAGDDETFWPVVRKMLLDKNFYCATAYLKAVSLEREDLEPLYRQLAFALDDPLLNEGYRADSISYLSSEDDNAFNEALITAAALRALFYNDFSRDYGVPALSVLIKNFVVVRSNPPLAELLDDLKIFKINMQRGIDYYADYRTKDKAAAEKNLIKIIQAAEDYYTLYFEGHQTDKAYNEAFIKMKKIIFAQNGDLGQIFRAMKDKNEVTSADTLGIVETYLTENFLKEDAGFSAVNLDADKLNQFITDNWDNACDKKSPGKLTGELKNNITKTLERAVEIMCAWTNCAEIFSASTEDSGTEAYKKIRSQLLDNIKAARKNFKGIASAGICVVDKTLEELSARLEGTFNPLDHKFFYIKFLCGDKVILDENYLPKLDLNISDGTREGIPEQIQKHAAAKLPKVEKCIEQIFENGGDDFGSAQLLDDYLKAGKGESFIAANYDLKKCISSAAKDAPGRKESFIGGLELAQSYGQFDVMPEGEKEKILQLAENCYAYAEESKNYGVFFRVIKHWEGVINKNAAAYADSLRAELQAAVESCKQVAQNLDADELKAAVDEIEQIIASKNFTVAKSLILKLSEGELYKKLDDAEDNALSRFIADYDDCYKKIYDSGSSLENLLAKKIFVHNKVSQNKLNLVKSWITNPVGEDKITALLKLLGFDVQTVQKVPSSAANTINFHVGIVDSGQIKYSHPIAAFGSDAEVDGFRVTCLFGRYDEKNLIDKFKDIGNSRHTLVFLDWALDLPTRRRLAKEIKLDKSLTKIFAIVDRVTIMYLFKNCAEQLGTKRITDTLMALIMPFARCQPYIWSPKVPLPPEMFIGRESEINEVTNQGGVNIVCGGRQLGKSALLKMACRKIDGHDGERAIYLDILDKDYRQAARLTSQELSDKNFFTEPFETDDWEDLTRAIKNRLASDTPTKIPYFLLMLDEADGFIESCADDNYAPIAALAKIQQDNHNGSRFKFVIAGLRNIIRFEREKILSNNNILPTLKSLTIKPFGLEDARKLLEVPLRYLGLYFPDTNKDSLILTILESANYFPSLIQLYCEKLVKALFETSYAGYNADTPIYTISEDHIKKVLADKEFTKDIKTKIEITLGLGRDQYYHAIANLLAYLYYNVNKVEGYSPRDILKAADDYDLVAKEILPASEEKIGALMEELCELNILRKTNAGNYLFSRQRILRVVGTRGEVDDALVKLMEGENG